MKTACILIAATAVLAAPAAAQTLLVDVNSNIPMAAMLDNPCTAQPEAIVFQGNTQVAQRVWALSNGNLRLQLFERTALEGVDILQTLPATKYVAGGERQYDLEFDPGAFSILGFKKVVREGLVDNFHSVLVIAFDPATLKVDFKLEPACDDGQP